LYDRIGVEVEHRLEIDNGDPHGASGPVDDRIELGQSGLGLQHLQLGGISQVVSGLNDSQRLLSRLSLDLDRRQALTGLQHPEVPLRGDQPGIQLSRGDLSIGDLHDQLRKLDPGADLAGVIDRLRHIEPQVVEVLLLRTVVRKQLDQVLEIRAIEQRGVARAIPAAAECHLRIDIGPGFPDSCLHLVAPLLDRLQERIVLQSEIDGPLQIQSLFRSRHRQGEKAEDSHHTEITIHRSNSI
jgi:hypothetical protein